MALPIVAQGTAGQVYTAAAHNVIADNLNQLGNGYTYVETVYFTSSGTFTKATYAYLRAIRVKVQAGGGAGGGATTTAGGQNSYGGGGQAGAYAESFITNIAGLDASVTVTIGAGGAGVSGAAGNDGGNSSFGTAVVAEGGSKGQTRGADNLQLIEPQNALGKGLASASTGDFKLDGGHPTPGAGLGPGSSQGVGGNGGAAFLSSGGSLGAQIGNGRSGLLYGGGGSGAHNQQSVGTARSGGSGGNGIVIVELYA